MSIRLDKYLVEMNICSRREAKEYCKKGRIKVNNIIEKKSDIKIDELKDRVTFDNREIVYEKFVYYMLNKPSGVVSATTDKNEITVIDLIKEDVKGLFPIGRLDKDTVGLLIITNDGELAHRLLSPVKHVPKTYYVKVEGKLTEEHKEMFKKGIELTGDGLIKPAELNIINSGDISVAELTIYEGKYHQVKRMMSSVGCKVIYLKRVRMGGLCLDGNLQEGKYRKLKDSEIDELCSECGGVK